MLKPKLIIMVGNIASGKTTWIKQFLSGDNSDEGKWVVLSKDDLRRMLGAGSYFWDEQLEPIIHRSFTEMLCNFMTWGINIILDETNMDKETRDLYLDFTKYRVSHGYDYKTIAVVMPKISRELAIERRCDNKDSAWGFSASTWRNVWEQKQGKFEMPTKEEEDFNEIWEIK